MFSIEFTYRFETAHRFTKGSSKCTTPHGHTWRATLGFEAQAHAINASDMVEEFETMKAAWREFLTQTVDHSFCLNHEDPIRPALESQIPGFRGLLFPGDPTTEMIAALFLKKAVAMRGQQPVNPAWVLVEETPTNRLRFSHSGLDAFSAMLGKNFDAWWDDPDPRSRKFSVSNRS